MSRARSWGLSDDQIAQSWAISPQKVADLREGRAGTLSMSYFTSAAMEWIPEIVQRVLAEHPRLRLDLSVRELPAGEAERTDVELLVAPRDFAAPPGFRSWPLMDEPYRALVREADAVFGSRRGLTPAVRSFLDFLGEHMASHGPGPDTGARAS